MKIWIIEAGGSSTGVFTEEGAWYGPAYHVARDETEVLRNICLGAPYSPPETIYFYGAGCSHESLKSKIKGVLTEIFSSINIMVDSDLLGAALALFKGREGLVAILGTGMSNAYYSKGELHVRCASGGYLFEDLGSGFEMGRRWMIDWLKGIHNREIIELTSSDFGYDPVKYRNEIYASQNPIKKVASIAEVLIKYQHHLYVFSWLKAFFSHFVREVVLKYPEEERKRLGFCGGVAYYFQQVIGLVLDDFSLTKPIYIDKAGPDLLKYWLEK